MTPANITIMSLTTFISVEPVEPTIISQLNTHFNIDHNMFLMEASVDLNRFFNSASQQFASTPKSLIVFETNATDRGSEFFNDVRAKNELLIVASNDTTFSNNLNLLMQIKAMQLLRLNIKVGLFFSHFVVDDLQQLFEWSFKNRIVNIFAATYVNTEPKSEPSLNVFAYNPFGTFRVINVTGRDCEHFFLSHRPNFQQYPLKLGKQDDNGRTKNVWSTICRMFNCSCNIVSTTFESPTIDVLPHLYTIRQLNQSTLYPFEMPTFTILVPEALPYSELISYLQNIFSNEFWFYSSVTLIAVTSLLCIGRYKKLRRIQFFECLADVINLLMNDNCKIKYQQLNGIERNIVIPLTFVGLVIMNGFVSRLQSHITQPYLQPQIETIEDIHG